MLALHNLILKMKQLIKSLIFGKTPATRLIRCGLLRGLRFHVDPNHKSQRLIGFDEREICAVTRQFAARVKTAVDIGANDGWYSLFFATLPGMDTVIACEPEAACVQQLEKNLSENACQVRARVSIVPRFIGTGNGQLAVDDVLENAAGPYLLKVDVDGGELEVLHSARKILAASEVQLIVETHSVELERDCVRFLSELGFKCTIVPNGWYRCLIPEQRPIPHNRWFYATKPKLVKL